MIAACAEVRVALSLWDPRADLPERLAVHLVMCAACRASFDERFPVARLPTPSVDLAARRRLLGPDRRPLAPLLAVALLLLGLGLGVPSEADRELVCEAPEPSALVCEDVAFGEPLVQECSPG